MANTSREQADGSAAASELVEPAGVNWRALWVFMAVGAIALAVLLLRHANSVGEIWASGLSDDRDVFSLMVEHDRLSAEGERYVFSTPLAQSDLIARLNDAYPDGSMVDERHWQVQLGDTKFIVGPNPLFPDDKSQFELAAQIACVACLTSEEEVVPFPKYAYEQWHLPADSPFGWDSVRQSGWSLEDWLAFYRDQPNVKAFDWGFALPTKSGETVFLYLTGGTFRLSKSPPID